MFVEMYVLQNLVDLVISNITLFCFCFFDMCMLLLMVYLSPWCSESDQCAGHLSCAPSEEKKSLERGVTESDWVYPWPRYQLDPVCVDQGNPWGAPPPASSSLHVLGPKRPEEGGDNGWD